MKNLTLIMLASAVIFATSCLGSGVSKSDYTIVGNFDGYASSDQLVAQYFKDSLRFAKQILTDEFSCLNSAYDENNSIFNGGFCLSMKKDSLNTHDMDNIKSVSRHVQIPV